MFVEDNNIYIGGTNVLPEWGKVVDDSKSLSEEQQKEMRSNVIERIQKMFRDYLELDNVSFLFGTGSSIHLGAASIQNIRLPLKMTSLKARIRILQMISKLTFKRCRRM